MEKTIEIPEGYEARIEGNKVILERKESEDERIRKLLVWQVYRNIEDETNDLAQSVYDGIKGHDPDLEESIEDWKKCLAWLEKHKEQKPYKPKNWPADKDNLTQEQKPILAKDEKFLEKEVKAFLCNYDKEFDDDAPTYDIAEHFYQLGKNAQKPAEWSEEDEKNLKLAYDLLVNGVEADRRYPELISWLKSLRHSWKPNEEQMLALGGVLDYLDESDNEDADIVRELINDLKKL